MFVLIERKEQHRLPSALNSFIPISKMERKMKKTIPLILSMLFLAISACAPQATASPTQPPTDEPAVMTETPAPVATDMPTAVDPPTGKKQYTNSAFKFGFKYPSNWFGPDEYISEQTLRLAVGSDVVYPYGEVPETPSEVKNSYLVVIQYTKNNQNDYWKDTYQSLANLKDGESLSGARNLTIRVRELQLGRFDGFEYISTLSETAQTEHVYAREIMLFDKQTNDLLSIMAQPNNVEVADPAKWREVYQSIDEANLSILREIVESITAE